MTFQEAEKIYKELRAQHEAGKLSDATFEAEVGKLRLQDAQGRWWQIGVQTGEWYVHDGQKWNKAKPPITPEPTPAAPSPDITAVLPRPVAPARATTPKAEKAEPTKKEPAPKKEGVTALPARLFSAKPAGRNGGLSRNVLIGIIAGVAVLCIILAVVGYMFLQGGAFGGIARANTPTPTRTIPLPTVPPLPTLPPPTNTPLLPPTPIITATLALPPTPTATRAAVIRTPTRTPTKGPQASPTVSAPPGVYALKLETIPPKVSIGGGGVVKVGFKLTVLNTTGSMQTRQKWFVRVFQAPEQTTGDNAYRNSYGESLKLDVNIGTGTVEITTPEHVQFGPGKCTYVAIPYYTQENNVPVPFPTTQGIPLYYSFNVCQ